MRKFERLNKKTNEKELFIGCQGTLKTIDSEPRPNKVSGKKYYRFTAELDTDKGPILVGGQVYEALIPHLGKTPEVGDRLDFNCKLSDLRSEKVNTRWGIGDYSIDSSNVVLEILDDPIFRKYNMLNHKTNKEETIISCIGKIRTIDSEPRINRVSHNKYYRFTGIIVHSKRKILIGGKVYKDQFEELGRTPQVGDDVNFTCNFSLLGGGHNKSWTIDRLIDANKDRLFESFKDEVPNQVLNKNDSEVKPPSSHSYSMDSNIYLLNFEELVEQVYNLFVREFGERKLKRIMYKVLTSRKVEGFIRESKLKKIAPHNDYIIQMLNEIPFFIFSRGQTVVVGGMVVLQKWNEEVNKDLRLLSDYELGQRARYIIEESKSMFF